MNLGQIVNMVKFSKNPRAALEDFMKQNASDPRIAQAMKLISGKNTDQLRETVENMARERGINLQEYISSLGLK